MAYSRKVPHHYENPRNVDSILAEDTIKAAVADYRAKHGAPVADAALRAAD